MYERPPIGSAVTTKTNELLQQTRSQHNISIIRKQTLSPMKGGRGEGSYKIRVLVTIR